MIAFACFDLLLDFVLLVWLADTLNFAFASALYLRFALVVAIRKRCFRVWDALIWICLDT